MKKYKITWHAKDTSQTCHTIYTHFIAGILDLSRGKAECKDGNCITILVGND